jgi:hypothetical protein
MAVILDERLQKACAYRRAHGREARLLLHIDHMHRRGKAFVGFPELLAVDWMPRCWPQSILVARQRRCGHPMHVPTYLPKHTYQKYASLRTADPPPL